MQYKHFLFIYRGNCEKLNKNIIKEEGGIAKKELKYSIRILIDNKNFACHK